MLTGAFAVYVLGLRHGADPDHLAAIDNLTRNSMGHGRPWLSRFVGTLFAFGHAVMLLAIATIVGFLGGRFASQGPLVERTGTWISIALLLFLAASNIRQLVAGKAELAPGLKTRFLPPVLYNATSPWAAIPIGLLFGFGFETSSQVAAYAVAFGARSGISGALAAASLFCLGMLCSDTLDSLFIHRLLSHRSAKSRLRAAMWVWSISAFAIAVAVWEFFSQC